MLGRASPRNPSVWMAKRSLSRRILLVAWRLKASCASSRSIPQPLSTTRMERIPPSSISTRIRSAPASMAFSISSFTTEAGRSTTSPAAIWLTSRSSKMRILPISSPSGLFVIPQPPLKLVQKLDRVERRSPEHVPGQEILNHLLFLRGHFSFFPFGLRHKLKQIQLTGRRRFRPAFQLLQNHPGPGDHRFRKPRPLRHVNSVTAVRPSRLDPVKKHHFPLFLNATGVNIDQTGKGLLQAGQLVIMGGK